MQKPTKISKCILNGCNNFTYRAADRFKLTASETDGIYKTKSKSNYTEHSSLFSEVVSH